MTARESRPETAAGVGQDTAPPLLRVSDLRVVYGGGRGGVAAVDGVTFDVRPGERLGLVGESGCGKTSLATALIRLRPEAAVSGSVVFDGRDLLTLSDTEMREVRGARIALALQGSGSAWSPVHRVIAQMCDALRAHGRVDSAQAESRARDAAARMHLRPALLDRFPHQLSGGEKQRAMLAMAVAHRPALLIADEPTSGLDPITAAEVLDDLVAVQSDIGFALLVASHNVVDVLRVTQRAAVLYAGRLTEIGAARDVVERPRHPYSWGLMASHPALNSARDLRGIRGTPPDPAAPPAGCRFHPRCTQAIDVCREQDPPLAPADGRLLACHLGGIRTALGARSLRFAYPKSAVAAVDGIDVDLHHGEVLGIVGETGSGKTTLARLLVGLLRPDAGEVSFEGRPLDAYTAGEVAVLRRGMQMVFQDPFEAISPRLTVREAVREPLDIQRSGTTEERDERVREALGALHLPVTDGFLGSRSHQLSGGQLQRVGVARALVLEPRVLVADEPVSMLDGSEQANLLNLLKALQMERGLALVLVSHDIAAACRLADRVMVMRAGRVVETGSSESIALHARDPYTRTLIGAARASGAAGDVGRPEDHEPLQPS